MLHYSKKRVFLLLACLLLINSVGVAAPATQITGPRVKNLKIYSNPNAKSQVAGDKNRSYHFQLILSKAKEGG